MDIKDPALILSTVDFLALLGAGWYFYKRNEELELKIAGLQKGFSTLTLKMANYDKAQQHRNDGLVTLNDRIKELGETMQQLPSTEHLENITEDVEEIVTALQENNIDIELPSQMNRAKASRRSARSDVDDNRTSSYGRRTGSRSTRDTDVKSRSRAPVKPELGRGQPSDQNRDQNRDQGRDTRDTRTQPARHYDEANDEDLIGAVRRQQDQ